MCPIRLFVEHSLTPCIPKSLFRIKSSDQLQWPTVIIGSALLVVSIVIPNNLSNLTKISLWGSDPSVVFGAGVPLLLAGIGVIIMQYLSKRSQIIMAAIEKEIVEIENELGQVKQDFKSINHRKGISASRLIRYYIIVGFALPMLFFGSSFILGLLWGTVFWILLVLAWLYVERSSQFPRT